MSTTNYYVRWAVYGALNTNTNINNYTVINVTDALQDTLDGGTTQVQMGNGIFGDPCFGIHKCWSACIEVNGLRYLFAGQEDEVVDFTNLPAPETVPGLRIANLAAQMVNGGWPNSQNNYLFSGCSFTVINQTSNPFPPSVDISQWVSLDFYFATSNDMNQQRSQLISIGDAPLNVNLGPNQQINSSILPKDLYNIGRFVTGNPGLITKGTPYYLYAQVRSQTNSQQLTGAFSQGTFTPNIP
ncbi:hypothetical protein OGH69_03145 [Flavobacterium sp. MFBS3-15]|uniref:hypothetical protein n=1 Tax=Flavobacterium sp. MFBS3-15 TaxID=2989816 RepID=UPI002235E42C|nr:hypothetical protein [Flavobacterium sp. MFBS3-15]MCW4467949.1 hypothetical protein [Flavobacterium sp. MFBS3-15]